jgi:hypothetical protein
MIIFTLVIAIIAIFISILSIVVIWRFSKDLKNTDNSILDVDKKVELVQQTLQKAIKNEAIDSEGNLKKKFLIS